jgi:hypothetical protein
MSASGTYLARQPKATRRHLHCRCYRRPPDRGCDYHYYRFIPVGASSVEAVKAGLTAAEVAAFSVPVVFSPRTSSSSSSESLRMMILLSPGGTRTLQLRSPKSLLVNSSSHETSTMRSPSLEDEEGSTTGAFPEGPPAQTSMSKGSMRRSPTGILMAVGIQMAPAEESWCHWVMGSPPWRESTSA